MIGKVLRRIYRYTSDRKFIESAGMANLGYKLNLERPQTFNEKMAWLKLYYHNPLLHKLVDKFEVKPIVDSIIGVGHTAKVLKVFDNIEDINFLSPPYVIKSTHYGVPIVVQSEKDIDAKKILIKLKKQARTSGYIALKEWGYKDLIPRVMFEEYLEDKSNKECLQDYKFWCFNGEPKYMYITVKFGQIFENFYDMSFEPVPINHGFPRRTPEFDKPKNFEEMKEIARKLSSGLPFVRIDLYDINGEVYFGEYTLFDWGGMHPFVSYEQDFSFS